MRRNPEHRVDKIVAGLMRGKRLSLRAGDAEEKEAITAAARLAGARHGPQRMTPAFRKKLAARLESAPDERWLTRRGALVAGLGLAAGAAAGVLAGGAMQPVPVRAGGQPIEPAAGTWVDVAALEDVPEGEGMRVSAGGVGAFVFRRGDQVTAVSSVCSHLPCELWWDRAHGDLACPCHPASFTADGRSASRGYQLPDLNKVHVRVTAAGRVEVLGTQ
jgi:cytochrome b6-f complex iron-sulfur subunit